MTTRSVLRGAVVTACVAAVCALAHAGIVRQVVHGRLAPTDETSRARGVFRMASQENDQDAVREVIEVSCARLDVSRDDEGNRPDYRLFLTTADEGTTADFGSFVLTRSGRARFRWSSRWHDYPEGVTTITAFGGGTIEVRLGDEVVLAGDVPEFVGPGDDPAAGSRGIRADGERLSPVSTPSRARGWINGRYANTYRGTNEQIRVRVAWLSRDGAPYTVVCIAGDSTETELGELTPRGRFGEARLVIDTRDGDEIPGGGGVEGLSQQTVEVRDVDGTTVLSGSFPDMTVE